MKVLILCAGNTMRTPLGSNRAQPALLTVKGKPVIEHILNKIQLLDGVNAVYILTNESYYEKFTAWAREYSSLVEISILNNAVKNNRDSRGACADLLYVLEKQAVDEDLLVIGGDNLFNFGLNDFIDFAKNRMDSVTTGAYSLPGGLVSKKYGLLKLDADNKVIDFCEKPPVLNGLRLVSICLYYFPKEMLKELKDYNSQCPEANDLGSYIEWLVKKQEVSGFRFEEGAWFDVSDEEDYSEAVFSF